MDPPTSDSKTKPENPEKVRESGPLYNCTLCDMEIVHKIAQALLPGLASACIDNTTGGIFKSPASVAVDIRKEMVECLTQRSEIFVSECVMSENRQETELSEHPYDIISDLIDDFASSKRNMFSKVSNWLLSERREDRIDDFVQELEINGFWLIGRRETIAQTLLKNVDYKNLFHCSLSFSAEEELQEHVPVCNFMTVNCSNEGCSAIFCAGHLEIHDSTCPFKIIPCEQKCSESIMRREMDRHCITVCPMKLVNCMFYPVGCQSTVPKSEAEKHNLENLHSHILQVLQTIHKEASVEVLKQRAKELEKSSESGRLVATWDVRSLTFAIKDLESNLGPMDDEFVESPKEGTLASELNKEDRLKSTTHEEQPEESQSVAI